MLGAVALTSLLAVLLLAPMVLGTHAVVSRASRRVTSLWLLALVGLSCVSLTLAAISLLIGELTQ
jgi:hypothetical protein